MDATFTAEALFSAAVAQQTVGLIDRAMRSLPASGSEWLAAMLVPFKVFVPAGYAMVVIQREVLGYRMNTGEITPFVLLGYVVILFVLALGATIQRSVGPRRAYLSTCAFVVAVCVFGSLLLPYLAHT